MIENVRAKALGVERKEYLKEMWNICHETFRLRQADTTNLEEKLENS